MIAALVRLCALAVSGYTAYMQRQQVRAAVWPILEFDGSNHRTCFMLTNKGVGRDHPPCRCEGGWSAGS
jgi:hypothetical protein